MTASRLQLATLVILPAAAGGWLVLLTATVIPTELLLAVTGTLLAVSVATYLATREQDHILFQLGAHSALLLVAGGQLWFLLLDPLLEGRIALAALARFLGRLDLDAITFAFLPLLGTVVAGFLAPQALLGGLGLLTRHRSPHRRRAASDLYGKSQLMPARELRRLSRGNGILLGQITRRRRSPLVTWPLEGSAITLAPPRTGKGATIALNLLAGERGHQGSTIVIDPRGEQFCIAARRRRRMGREVILIDPFSVVATHAEQFGDALHLPVTKSDTYNPLDFIRDDEDLAVRDINVLLDALLTPPAKESSSNAQHFHVAATQIIAGYIAWVRFREDPENRTLEQVRRMVMASKEAREAFAFTVDRTPEFCGGLTRIALQRQLALGPDEAGSTFSTIANQLAFLQYPELRNHVARSTFDPAVIARGDADIFVVVPDNMLSSVKSWLRLWITIPNAIPEREALESNLLLIIDEMPQLGYLRAVMDSYNMAAGKGINFWCFAQSLSALDATWGREHRRTLIDLAEVVQILGFSRTDHEHADHVSKVIGHATFEASSESRSASGSGDPLTPGRSQTQTGENTSLVRERVVTPEQLMGMAPDEQYVIAASKAIPRHAMHLRHARYWERPEVANWADPNPFVIRKQRAQARAS